MRPGSRPAAVPSCSTPWPERPTAHLRARCPPRPSRPGSPPCRRRPMIDPEREREIVRRRLLGQGLACTPVTSFDVGRDLELVPGPHGLDLARVSGIDNLGQALAIALTTLLGTD